MARATFQPHCLPRAGEEVQRSARYSQSLVPVVELANQACHHLSSDPGQLTSREENVCHAQPLWFCPDD